MATNSTLRIEVSKLGLVIAFQDIQKIVWLGRKNLQMINNDDVILIEGYVNGRFTKVPPSFDEVRTYECS